MQNQHHILLVEDDPNLGLLLSDYLETEGFQVSWKQDGQSALQVAKRQGFSLGILDVMMPGMDGFALARNLREQAPELPFLFLTARLLKEDKLAGYALGAEDYITKPFDEAELLCKIRVILRRAAPGSPSDQIQTIGRYRFDYSRQELSLEGGESVRLTEKENEVMQLLCEYRNRILRRDEAVSRIYGKYDYFLGRSFDVFISRIRKLLKDDPQISIENVYKVGFMLKTPG